MFVRIIWESSMLSQPTSVFVTFQPHPERAARLRELLGMMVEHTRLEPGCERYDLYRSGDPAAPAFHLFERYVDTAALESHRASDHYRQYRAVLPELLEQPIEVTVLAGEDVAG
jgi:quinol monooxygenase YgiN